MKLNIIFLALLFVSACSATVTGPITKNKYNLDVGCTDDMREYKEARGELLENEIKQPQTKQLMIDCPTAE